MPDHRHRAAAETAEPGDHRLVLAIEPVAGKRRELVDQMADVIGEMRPVLMARDQRLLPRRQLGIGIPDQRLGLGLEPRDIGVDVHGRIVGGELAQLDDLAFQFGNRLFEIEIGVHLVLCLDPKRAGKVANRPVPVNKGGWQALHVHTQLLLRT